MAKLLEGRPIAQKIKEEIRQAAVSLGRSPVLASIQAGDNAGAASYIRSQQKAAQELGVDYQLHNLPVDISEGALIDFVRKLNSDKGVNGIIIQMPLPARIDYKKISRFISPDKDVEGMHPANIGRIVFGRAKVLPCTAAAVMEILGSAGVDLNGREAVVVGHSEIVGKPLALLLLENLATVTVCHIGTSKAGKLEEHVRRAEVLIVAVGVPELIKGAWIKEGAVVVDVGINRVEGKIVGDVEFVEAEKKASAITPVPGGVGPLTATMLMRNLFRIAQEAE